PLSQPHRLRAIDQTAAGRRFHLGDVDDGDALAVAAPEWRAAIGVRGALAASPADAGLIAAVLAAVAPAAVAGAARRRTAPARGVGALVVGEVEVVEAREAPGEDGAEAVAPPPPEDGGMAGPAPGADDRAGLHTGGLAPADVEAGERRIVR